MHSFQNLYADIRFFEQKGLYSTEKQQKILYFTVFEIFFVQIRLFFSNRVQVNFYN